jgi:hypothetical protein
VNDTSTDQREADIKQAFTLLQRIVWNEHGPDPRDLVEAREFLAGLAHRAAMDIQNLAAVIRAGA